jgi:hypothetical protein
VSVYRLDSVEELVQLKGHRGPVTAVDFSLDGQWLASASFDTTALVWDARALCKRIRDKRTSPTAEQLEAAWASLAGEEAVAAHRALWRLVWAREQAVPFLKQHLHPVPAPDAHAVARRLGELDSDDFRVREQAMAGLARLGDRVEGDLQAARESASSEASQRIDRLLQRLRLPSPAHLQQLRALEALEQMGTPAARKLLAELAGGAAGAWLTREARASRERLPKSSERP